MGLDVLLVVVLGGAVVLLKQSLVHDNRRQMTEQYRSCTEFRRFGCGNLQ